MTPGERRTQFSSQDLIRHLLLPTEPEGLRAALELAYFLSLETEEKRQMQVALAFDAGEEVLPSELRFRPQPDATPSSLRKIAVTADPVLSCLVLAWDAAGQRLIVRGIAHRPDIASHPAGYQRLLLIRVRGPGRVSIVTGLSEILYDRGAIKTPSSEVPIPESTITALTKHITTLAPLAPMLPLGRGGLLVSREGFKQHETLIRELARGLCVHLAPGWIGAILERVDRSRKGGGLLLPGAEWVNVRMPGSGTQLEPALDSLNGAPWNRGFLDALGWLLHVALAQQGKLILSDVKMSPQEWLERVGAHRVDAAAEALLTDADRVAALASTDGALVLDQILAPAAFGVKLTGGEPPDEFKRVVQARGLRHNSMARAVGSLGSGVGYVVSEDGGCTFLEKTGDAYNTGHREF